MFELIVSIFISLLDVQLTFDVCAVDVLRV